RRAHALRRPRDRVADPADGAVARVGGRRALLLQRADRVGVRHDVHAVWHVLHGRLGVDAAEGRPHPHRRLLRPLVAAHAGARRPRVLPRVLLPPMLVMGWVGAGYFWKSGGQNERIVTGPWLAILWPCPF